MFSANAELRRGIKCVHGHLAVLAFIWMELRRSLREGWSEGFINQSVFADDTKRVSKRRKLMINVG